MKNFDAKRRWLKCVMGWERHDRSSTWRTRGKGGRPQEHFERWVSPYRPGKYRRSMTFEGAMRQACKDAGELFPFDGTCKD